MHLSLKSNATRIETYNKCESRTLSKKAMCHYGLVEAQLHATIRALVISPNCGYLIKACQLR